MKIYNNNVSFCSKVPTISLLKVGTGIHEYEDAKNLCIHINNKFPGHLGYFKKAVKFANEIAKKNENISEMFESINSASNKNDKLLIIRKIALKEGKEIDVII